MAFLSAFADEVTDNFRGQVKFLSSEQLRYIEIRFVDKKNVMDLTIQELREVKCLLDDHGIGVSALGSPIGKISLDEPFDRHLDKYKHSIDLALFFGTSLIRIFSYYAPEGRQIDDCREEIVQRMNTKVDLLRDTELILAVENSSGTYCDCADNCVDLIRTIHSDKLKLAYDPGNFVWGQKRYDNYQTCWSKMKSDVIHMHIKDWKVGSDHVGSIPGKGDGQIKELLADLASMNYDGFLTLEPHLKSGGQFGGETGPELFTLAIAATRELCRHTGLRYDEGIPDSANTYPQSMDKRI